MGGQMGGQSGGQSDGQSGGHASDRVSELFDPQAWTSVAGFESLDDISYHHDTSGRIARIAFNRPEVRNAFRPRTVDHCSPRSMTHGATPASASCC